MAIISRDIEAATRSAFDLIVVGGGIYGAMVSLEAALRGLRPLLLESDDFGAATSFNSLRTIHGGLRYLQTGDLRRFHESVNERRWFLTAFPELVRPLPCLMPFYGKGLQRPGVMKLALFVNDLLSLHRNKGVRKENRLLPGKVLNAQETQRRFPLVDRAGLQGAAQWYDGSVPDSQRLLIEVIRWACTQRCCALNYVEATELITKGTNVRGVVARDRESGSTYKYFAPVVINAAGPWCRDVARQFDRDNESLFRNTLAWNLLFDVDSLSEYALAVAPKRRGAQVYFIHPWKGKLLAGTGHAPAADGPVAPPPSPSQIFQFINDINEAVPGLSLSESSISRVFWGLLPAKDKTRTNLAVREIVLDHAQHGGPKGLFTISGVKFTTSRRVAEKCLNLVYGCRRKSEGRMRSHEKCLERQDWDFCGMDFQASPRNNTYMNALRNLIENESVIHLDDLVIRRTTIWEDADHALSLAPALCSLFSWSQSRCREEISRLSQSLQREHGALPGANIRAGTGGL